MNRQHFTISQRLPSLNDYIGASRKSPYAGAQLKKQTDADIRWDIAAAKLRTVENPCIVLMVFCEADRRRDVDNVESARKYVLDALVSSGVLQGDSPRWVIGAPTYTEYGEHPKVDVTIIESEDTDALRTLLRASAAGIRG